MTCADMDFPDIPETEQEAWKKFETAYDTGTREDREKAIRDLLDALGVPPGPPIDFRQFRPMLCTSLEERRRR